jgi:hypothetical protein
MGRENPNSIQKQQILKELENKPSSKQGIQIISILQLLVYFQQASEGIHYLQAQTLFKQTSKSCLNNTTNKEIVRFSRTKNNSLTSS